MQPTDFLFFQAKDAITGVIALGALTIGLTNLYNAYLRRPKVVSTPGNHISLASRPDGEKAKFRIFMLCLFYNKGSEPALVISLLVPVGAVPSPSTDIVFQWHEFVSREEVRDSGALHPKGIRAIFEGEAFALVLPRTDAVEKEIVFVPAGKSGLLKPGEYVLSLEGAFIGRGKRLRKFRSWSARLKLKSEHLALAKERMVRDAAGQYLYSNHVRIDSVPELGT